MLFWVYPGHVIAFKCDCFHLSLVTRKPVFGVCDQVRRKPVCSATETSWRLEISDIETRGIIISRQRKQKRWSDCADAQAYLRLCCSHMAKAGFVMMWLIWYAENCTASSTYRPFCKYLHRSILFASSIHRDTRQSELPLFGRGRYTCRRRSISRSRLKYIKVSGELVQNHVK